MKNNFYLFLFIYLGAGGKERGCNLYGTVLLDTSSAVFRALLQSLGALWSHLQTTPLSIMWTKMNPLFFLPVPSHKQAHMPNKVRSTGECKKGEDPHLHQQCFSSQFFFLSFQSVYSKRGCLVITLSVNRICWYCKKIQVVSIYFLW